MKLVADRLARIRGGRTLFSGLSFAVEGGEALLLLGPNGAGKTTLIRMIVGPARAGRGPHRPRRRRCRAEPGRAMPLCWAFERREVEPHRGGERALLVPLPRRQASIASRLRSPPSGSRICATSPRPICRPGRSGGWGSPACCSPTARSGCSTSRRFRSTAPPRTCSAAAVDAHIAAGGLVVAATHAPLGFAKSRELHLGGTARARMSAFRRARAPRSPPRLEGGRHGRRGARLLPGGGDAAAAGHRARPQSARPHRARRAVGGAAARRPAVARPHVRDRPRGRLARGAGDRPAAARRRLPPPRAWPTG